MKKEKFKVKKFLCVLLIINFYLTYLFVPSIQALESSSQDSFINSIEADITGDGFKEYIRLEGNLLADDSTYYHNVWLDITNPFSKTWNINLKSGYDPDVNLLDINNDKTLDLFYEVSLNEEKTSYATQLYTWKGEKAQQLELPKTNSIKGTYANNFTIEMTIEPGKAPISVKVPDQSLAMEQGFYDADGNILEKISVDITPVRRYEPILISESKGHGLKTTQSVKDIITNQVIGSVETIWYMKNSEWIILQKKWRTS